MKKVFFFVPVCLLLAGCFGEAAVPSGDPGKKFSRKIRGYKYHQDTMLATSGQAYWAQEVLSPEVDRRQISMCNSSRSSCQTKYSTLSRALLELANKRHSHHKKFLDFSVQLLVDAD